VWSRKFSRNEDVDPTDDYGKEIQMWAGRLNFARMINSICNHPPRNEYIVDILKHVLAKEPSRQILIMSERKAQLQHLEKLLRKHNVGGGSIGYYVGGMKAQDMETSTKQQILLATVQICAEGFDVPTLNTLVLASPISSMEQPVGRIQRQKPEDRKYIPMVIDVWDQHSIFKQQGLRRLQFYKRNGYKIVQGDSPWATYNSDDAESEDIDTTEDVECNKPAAKKTYDFVEDE
jgi:superfamily II DNA or RNA helicase